MAIFANKGGGWAEQDVGSLLDYSEDWSDFIVGSDQIASSEWSSNLDDLTLSGALISGALTTVWISGGVAGRTYRITNVITTQQGRRDLRFFMLTVVEAAAVEPVVATTALFTRFRSVKEFKTESLAFLDRSFPVDKITDDFIWSKLIAAEKDASHALRVFFEPTVVIPEDAPAAEVDALVAAGTKFVQEPAYDYDPQGWTSNAWGVLLTRKSPIIRVDSVHFTYPNPTSDVLKVPLEWVRLDKKYGHVRFVPTGSMMALGPMSTYIMTAIASGRVIPNMIHMRYVAGLENPARDFPDLIALVKRMAVLLVLKSAFLPQSGSISADGLSQSTSIDTSKWQEDVDADLGRLRDTIHGIRFGVL